MREWNMRHYRNYIQYKNRSSDQDMHTSLLLLRQRILMVAHNLIAMTNDQGDKDPDNLVTNLPKSGGM
jgi:hypothetical protein